MRSLRLLALLAVPALFALTETAEAHDYGCGPYGGHPAVRGGSVTCNRSGTCYVRDRCHPSTRYVLPRHTHRGGCGSTYVRPNYGPWSRMRRHMSWSRVDVRRSYMNHYFLRRYPFCLRQGETIEEAANVGLLLAIGDEASGLDRKLDTQGLLDRGAARFHVGNYKGAREDFTAVLAKKNDEHRARIGLAMTDVVASKWLDARKQLDILAKAGELRAEDRIDAESLFADASKLPSITKSLKDTVGYRMMKANAHTVTAWLLLGQGDVAGATRFVKLAKRYGSATPARTALEEAVGLTSKPAPNKAQPAEETREESVRPPNPALHRQVARVDRPKQG